MAWYDMLLGAYPLDFGVRGRDLMTELLDRHLVEVPLCIGELGRVYQLPCALPGRFIHVDGKKAKRSTRALGFSSAMYVAGGITCYLRVASQQVSSATRSRNNGFFSPLQMTLGKVGET